jgi:hypothetical protein
LRAEDGWSVAAIHVLPGQYGALVAFRTGKELYLCEFGSRWLGTLEATLHRAASSVQSSRRFLTQENLLPLADAADVNSEEHEQYVKFLRQCPKQ